ncbi:hypothetical protein [Streptomyces sp. NPDC058280]|uniref:hypothetical protein n=1 Tax=Streptomyces sp. NPDC058280 TaxID=3346419 RepID=UPI0036E51544
MHEFLGAAAEWCERHQEPDFAQRYRGTAQRLAELGDQLAYLGEDRLAAAYQRTTTVGSRPAPLPAPPPPGPAPEPRRRPR